MPYCRTCGAAIAKQSPVCPDCGTPTTAEVLPSPLAIRSRPLPRSKTNGTQVQSRPFSERRETAPRSVKNQRLGLVGLVASLAGLIAPFMGLLGLILSLVAYRRAKRYGAARGFALAGIAVGILSLLIYALAILA